MMTKEEKNNLDDLKKLDPEKTAGTDDKAQKQDNWEEKYKEAYDAMLRAKAEVENIKKRSEKEISNAYKFSTESIFLDLIPIRSPRRVLLSETFTVGGGQAEVSSKQSSLSHHIGERSFTLDVQKNEISGDEYILKLKARNSQGDPLTLKAVMGAHAHLVAFDWERKGFAHLHPLEAEGFIGPVTNSITSDLEFSFNSSRIFSCRLWAQVLLENDENETFIPFSLNLNSLSDETN